MVARLKEKEEVTEVRCRAETGDGLAQLALAVCYHMGLLGIVQDAAKAFKWFKRAADNNHPCNYNVGYGYATGKGVETNWNRALMYFERGVAKGEAVCCFELGHFFDRGLMVASWA